jgi:hypothetical protein
MSVSSGCPHLRGPYIACCQYVFVNKHKMKRSLFRNITPHNHSEVARCFRVTCCLHIQGWRISKARKQNEVGRKQPAYVPEEITPHMHCYEIQKSYKQWIFVKLILCKQQGRFYGCGLWAESPQWHIVENTKERFYLNSKLYSFYIPYLSAIIWALTTWWW